MYEENEYDWTVLKDYKKDKKSNLNNKVKDFNRLNKEFKKQKIEVSGELSTLNGQDFKPLHLIENSKRYVEKNKKNKFLNDLNDDITKSETDVISFKTIIDTLTSEIIEIEEKIRAIRTKKHAKETANNAAKKKKKVVEECPKKCKVSNITIACSHGRTMEVSPFVEGGDIPTLHVVSGSNTANKDIVTIKMAGSCDHGKKQTADDNKEFKITERLVGNNQFCPNTKIVGNNNDVNVHRPNGVEFNAATNLKLANTSPVYVLLKRLVFGDGDDTTEYDVSFGSCKGNYPYKAKVIAHPKEEWKLDFSFGYKAAYESKTSKRKFAQDERVETYDAMTCNGKWEAVLAGSYTYDSVTSKPVNVTLSLDDLVKELKGTKWGYLASLVEFFEPINAFFENAIGYSEGADEKYGKTKAKADKKAKTIGSETSIVKIDFEGPTIKIGGNYAIAERKALTTKIDGRKLTAPLYKVGGKGELSVGFDPLLRVTGTIDILQLLMCTLGGGLGPFLTKVSNMSMGKKDDDGGGTYIETKLTLGISLTSSLAGNLVFECTQEKGWDASEKTSVGGFIGFKLAGKAAIDGQVDGICFKVSFGAGAEFKTTDETGAKDSGIEVNYKPTMIANKFNWAGEFIFNGLSIVWVTYAKGGVDGASKDKDNGEGKSTGRMNKIKKDKEVKADDVQKELSDIVPLFKKRALFANDDAGNVNA